MGIYDGHEFSRLLERKGAFAWSSVWTYTRHLWDSLDIVSPRVSFTDKYKDFFYPISFFIPYRNEDIVCLYQIVGDDFVYLIVEIWNEIEKRKIEEIIKLNIDPCLALHLDNLIHNYPHRKLSLMDSGMK